MILRQPEAPPSAPPLPCGTAVFDLIQRNPRATAELSFPYFCYYYLRSHFEYGFGKFQYPIMEKLQELQPNIHTLLLLPREHGKSTLITFAFVLWKICYRKKRHIVLGSSVTDTSEKFLANIKAELQSNELILRDFGDLVGEPLKDSVKRPWRAERVRTRNHVVIVATSTGATVRGLLERLPETLTPTGADANGNPTYTYSLYRPDLVIMDDIIDDKRILSKSVRDRTWWWFWKNLFPAMQMGEGNLIVVGTPLHDDDTISRLRNDKIQTTGWQKFVYPAANPDRPFDANGNPIDCLFPEKWARLDMTRPINDNDPVTGMPRTMYRSYLWWRSRELALAFGPEFLLRPMSDSMKFFNQADFGWYVVKSSSLRDEVFRTVFETTGKLLEYLPADLICTTTVDPAGTDERRMQQGTDPDYSVVMTTGYSPTTRKFYMVAVNRMRTTPFNMLRQILTHVQMFSAAHGARYVPDPDKPHEYYSGFPFFHIGVGVETVAFQKVLAPMFEEIAASLGMYPNVFEFPRGGRQGKRLRAMLPSTLSQNGLLMFPFPVPGYVDPDSDACIQELVTFPQPDGHDDCVDAFTDGIHILYAYSLLLGRGLLAEEAVQELLRNDYGFRALGRVGNIGQYITGTGEGLRAAVPA